MPVEQALATREQYVPRGLEKGFWRPRPHYLKVFWQVGLLLRLAD